jgi:hypothetical protein
MIVCWERNRTNSTTIRPRLDQMTVFHCFSIRRRPSELWPRDSEQGRRTIALRDADHAGRYLIGDLAKIGNRACFVAWL